MKQEKSVRCEGVAIVCHLAKNRITLHCIRRHPSNKNATNLFFVSFFFSCISAGRIFSHSFVNTKFRSIPRIYRDEPGSLVTVSMVDLPKQRYVRRNVKTVLDYVST